LAALLFAVPAITGCGSNGKSATQSTNGADKYLPRNIVTHAAISAQPPGSPQRALLEWWRGFQFGDVVAVVDGSTSDARDP